MRTVPNRRFYMLSEVLKELPTSDYVKPKRRARTTSPAVKKAYKKGYLNKNQETFTREESVRR